MAKWEFAVYKHSLVYDGDKLILRCFIVLKDGAGQIIAWTDFHKYIDSHNNLVVTPLSSTGVPRFRMVSKLLNFIFFEKYNITSLDNMTNEMVIDFLCSYGLCKLPSDTENTHRNSKTVELCVQYIMDFLEKYAKDNKKCKVEYEKLFEKKVVFSKKKKKYIERRVPAFDVFIKPGADANEPIFRDIPDKAFVYIMDEIAENHKNILMLACLSAFAGLRPSEACNVRRPDSALGPGLRFEIVDGEIYDIHIDLMTEKNLRSDLVHVGDIKKERKQRVYPAFLRTFYDAYQIYERFLQEDERQYESEYGALTNTKSGKAYTYGSYLNEFKNAVADCLPRMLADEDPEIVNYAHLVKEHGIGPHILRHWFSVQLVLFGEDVSGIMYWRGDKSPESALTYLAYKSDLEKQYKRVNNAVFDYNLWRASKMHKK